MQLFVEYYQKQGVVPEGQWEEFMEVLKTPLPTTFRINGTGKFATDLRDKLESDFLSNFNKDPIMVCTCLAVCVPSRNETYIPSCSRQASYATVLHISLTCRLQAKRFSPPDLCRGTLTSLPGT